jgi:hypothetical protein
MNVESFFFIVGCALAVGFGCRVVVRLLKFLQVHGLTHTTGPAGEFVSRLQLKDTLLLDVLGWIVGLVMAVVSLLSLR